MILHITPDQVPMFLAVLVVLPIVAIVVASWVGMLLKREQQFSAIDWLRSRLQ